MEIKLASISDIDSWMNLVKKVKDDFALLLCGCGKTKLPPEETPVTEESTTEKVKQEETITIEEPSKKTEKQTEKETTKKEETTTKKADPTTSKPAPSTTKPSTTKPQVPSTTKAPENKPDKKPETTTQKQEPTKKKPEPSTTKPATTEPKPYSCGSKNHHCTSKEEHAFIVSLEEKGCPICSSHSCKSFYALDLLCSVHGLFSFHRSFLLSGGVFPVYC